MNWLTEHLMVVSFDPNIPLGVMGVILCIAQPIVAHTTDYVRSKL